MAQYRLSAAVISRAQGKSVIAAAAYRSANKLLDERTGDIKDYSRRAWSVLYTRILTPENAPVWMEERERLWNGVEHREDQSTKRGTAQLARDIELSLPYELTHEQHVELVCEFVQAEFVDRGMVADIAIHAPPRRGDGTNHHAHILLTMRDIKGDGFGLKNRVWNDDELLEHWRERWEVYQNRTLEKHGHEARVDHRSLEDQGIDREPTQHLGPTAQKLEDQGIHTDRGDENRRIKAANDNLALLKNELAQSEQRIAELKQQLTAERMEEIQKTVRAVSAAGSARKKDEEGSPLPPERAPEPQPPAQAPGRTRPTNAERMEQIQKTVRAAEEFWKGPKPRPAPAPEPAPEPPAKQPEPEPPAKQPEPEPPALPPPPVPSGPASRRRPPAAYDLIARMKYAERAKEEEEKQTAEREREKEEQERERKPDRER